MRHLQQEYLKNKNVLLLATRFMTFPLVELSLGWMLSSRALFRFTQQANVFIFNLTQFIEQTPHVTHSFLKEKSQAIIFRALS